RKERQGEKKIGEPSKEEKAVAKYLRFNCPTKSTNMMGHRVDYFIASKAVDCLLDSKWAKAKKGEEALFTTRESVVDYCNSQVPFLILLGDCSCIPGKIKATITSAFS
uniref:Translocation protein SEC62 n=1 Tax=Ursus americanus TaxID=9643 RepID=A0A452RNS0_URSAM